MHDNSSFTFDISYKNCHSHWLKPLFFNLYLNLFNLSLVLEDSEEAKDDIDDTDSARSLDAFSAFSEVNPNTHPIQNVFLSK